MSLVQAIVYFVLAAVLILSGTITLWKKTMTFHRWFSKSSVDVKGYTRYMGIVDIFFGAFYAVFGVVGILTPEKTVTPFYILATLIFYCALLKNGERRYKIK